MEFAPSSPKTSALKLALPGWRLFSFSFLHRVKAESSVVKLGGGKGKRFAKMIYELVAHQVVAANDGEVMKTL